MDATRVDIRLPRDTILAEQTPTTGRYRISTRTIAMRLSVIGDMLRLALWPLSISFSYNYDFAANDTLFCILS